MLGIMNDAIEFDDDSARAAALREFSAAMGKSRERAKKSLVDLKAALPVLERALYGDSGQSQRVRHIVWSLYTCDHLVPLGNVCSGLDVDVAEAVAAAITARLFAGAEVESLLKGIMTDSGEFNRLNAVRKEQQAQDLPIQYPLPLESAKRLRELAEVAEAYES